MKKVVIVLIVAVFSFSSIAQSQSLKVPASDVEINLNDTLRPQGFRFSLVDAEVEEINATELGQLFNRGNQETVNGLSLGLGSWVEETNGMASGMVLGGKSMKGLSMSFVSIFDDLIGVSITGYGGGGKTLTGLGIGLTGYEVKESMAGVLISGGILRSGEEMTGLFVGGIGNVGKNVTGVQIGLFNRADTLNGIQLGLLNYVGNNPDGLKLLPGLNAHFSF